MSETLTRLYGRNVDIVHFEKNLAHSLTDDGAAREIIWI